MLEQSARYVLEMERFSVRRRRAENGDINLWRLYNLFTGSNKSSYIDTFLDRSVNAFRFVDDLRSAMDKKETNWFLN